MKFNENFKESKSVLLVSELASAKTFREPFTEPLMCVAIASLGSCCSCRLQGRFWHYSQMGGHNSSWRGRGPQYAAELRILLVYLSESLGRLGQKGGGALGDHIFHWGTLPPPVEPPLTGCEFTVLLQTL